MASFSGNFKSSTRARPAQIQLCMRNIIAISLVFCFCALSAQQFGTSPAPGVKQKTLVHVVSKGETLYGISKQYNAEIEAIRRLNRMNEGGIQVGQSLKIPVATAVVTSVEVKDLAEEMKTAKAEAVDEVSEVPAEPQKPALKPTKPESADITVNTQKTHMVEKGQTLYAISRMYEGVSVENIIEWNELKDYNISEGAELLVSAGLKTEKVQEEAPRETYDAVRQTVDAQKVVPDSKITEMEEGPAKINYDDIQAEIDGLQPTEPEEVSSAPVETDSKFSYDSLTAMKVDDFGAGAVAEKGDRPFKSLFDFMVGKGADTQNKKGVAAYLRSGSEQDSYFALYDGADKGTVLRVRNLMNNRTVYLKVVGSLPQTDKENDVFLKISGIAANQLDIHDAKFLAEVTSYKRD